MKGRNRRIILAVQMLMLLFTNNLSGQNNDFRAWTDFDFSGNLTEKTGLSLSFSERFRNNITRIDRSLITGSMDYKVLQNVFIEGGYRYIILNDIEDGWISRHRVHADIFYAFKFVNWRFKLKERVQYGFDDLNSITEMYLNKLTNRVKLDASHDINNTPFGIYGSFELFLPFGHDAIYIPSNFRVEGGLAYEISSKSALQAGYLLDKALNMSDTGTFHIVHLTFQCTIF